MAEEQEMEWETLQAIYMEDLLCEYKPPSYSLSFESSLVSPFLLISLFLFASRASAIKDSFPRSFGVTIKTSSYSEGEEDAESLPFVLLEVTYTPNYPSEVPIMRVKSGADSEEIDEEKLLELQTTIDTAVRALPFCKFKLLISLNFDINQSLLSIMSHSSSNTSSLFVHPSHRTRLSALTPYHRIPSSITSHFFINPHYHHDQKRHKRTWGW
jgi:hypothetical protein